MLSLSIKYLVLYKFILSSWDILSVIFILVISSFLFISSKSSFSFIIYGLFVSFFIKLFGIICFNDISSLIDDILIFSDDVLFNFSGFWFRISIFIESGNFNLSL